MCMEEGAVAPWQNRMWSLALGFSKSVITVQELLAQGDLDLGTFEDVDGEMIVIDGKCYRALDDGSVVICDCKDGQTGLYLR